MSTLRSYKTALVRISDGKIMRRSFRLVSKAKIPYIAWSLMWTFLGIPFAPFSHTKSCIIDTKTLSSSFLSMTRKTVLWSCNAFDKIFFRMFWDTYTLFLLVEPVPVCLRPPGSYLFRFDCRETVFYSFLWPNWKLRHYWIMKELH